jgi:DNA-binding NarL/FixJ family response regulator
MQRKLAVDRIVQTELDLIGVIYDAVLEPDRWSDTIDRIRRYVGMHMGVLGIQYFPSGVSVQATSNVAPEHLKALAETADSVPPLWGGVAKMSRIPIEEPVRMLDYSRPEWWPGNPFYERFCRPQGLDDQLAMVIEFSPSLLASLGMGHHESMPPISDDQIEMCRPLIPHLRRAVLISNLLLSRSIVASSFEAALDALGSAVLLVDARGRIIYANEQADNMLRKDDPIAQLGGRLVIPRELVKGQFEQAIAAAASGEEALRHGAGLPVRRADGSGMIVHVLPLRRRSTRAPPAAVAAVFVAPPSAELNMPLEAMRILYDLRPAEVRVLDLVARGVSGKGVGEALGISQNTAKTHTLRLFDKVGVHSRAELIRLVHEMSVGVR